MGRGTGKCRLYNRTVTVADSLKHCPYSSRLIGQRPTSRALNCSKYMSSLSLSFFTSSLVAGRLDIRWRKNLPSASHSRIGIIRFSTSSTLSSSSESPAASNGRAVLSAVLTFCARPYLKVLCPKATKKKMPSYIGGE